MYLVSLYFDEKTNKHIQSFIKQVAKKTGNQYMIDGNVPPHITIAAFETPNLQAAAEVLESTMSTLKRGKITWGSVATFFPHVIYFAPVLNHYLHMLSETINGELRKCEEVRLRANYQPFHWLPHTTIAKKLTPDEMRIAFEVLQHSFGLFEGEGIKIGLAKTNPYEDIKVWHFE